MKQLSMELPEATSSPPLNPPEGFKHAKVPDSVLCDVSNDDTAQINFMSSIGHYLSWQYVESDFRVEFGSERRRSFVTRPFGTFVFYFRYNEFVVGLIVDGQQGYVVGCITQIYRDGVLSQENVLQFRRTGSEGDYIKSKRTHTLKFSGNYTEGMKVCDINLSLSILRKAIRKIVSFRPKIDQKEPGAVWFQVLILYAAEAPRIRGVMVPAVSSLSPKTQETVGVVRIPNSEEAFVLNYKQLSFSALECIKRKKFNRVTGTTPRNLIQILSSVLLLRRAVTYPTKFLLPDAPREGPEKPLQGQRGQQISKDKRLELLNARGSKYSPLLHGGADAYDSEPWILHLWEDTVNKDVDKTLTMEGEADSVLEEVFIKGLSSQFHKTLTMEGEADSVLEEVFMNGLSSQFHKICSHDTFSRKAVPESSSAGLSESLVLRDIGNKNEICSHDTFSRKAVPESSSAGVALELDEFIDRCSYIKKYPIYDHYLQAVEGDKILPASDPPTPSSPGNSKMPGTPKTERSEPRDCKMLPKVGNKVMFSLCQEKDHTTNAKRKQIAMHEPVREVTARKRKQDEASSAAQGKKAKDALQVNDDQLGAHATCSDITTRFDYLTRPLAMWCK